MSLEKISIDIDVNSLIYEQILIYTASFKEVKNYYIGNFVKKDNDFEIEFKLPYGQTTINYNNSVITVDFNREGAPVGLSYNVKVMENLKITGESKEVLEKFIFDAKKYSEPKKNDEIICKIWKSSYWSVMSKIPKRPFDSLILDGNNKELIMNDINDFLNTKEDYDKYGIPYKRNYMLEGKPGTGKTSLITTIASKVDMDIAIITFGPKMDDTTFMTAISNLPSKSILILEDIDVLFTERKKGDGNNSFVSFSCILNVLDGISRKDGLITFMTTNYIDNLDSALIRPGRIDYKLSFDFATKKQVKNMFEYFLPNQIENFDKFYKKINKYNITTSSLQKFLFENRNCSDINNQIIIDKFIEIIKDNNKSESMYT